MKKILVIASTLGRDGTSRFLTYFANEMSKRQQFSIKILFFRPVDPTLMTALEAGVNVESLNIEGKLWKSFFRIIFTIIKIHPQLCLLGFHQLLFFAYINPILHLFGIKLAMRDTIIPSLYHKKSNIAVKLLVKSAYRKLDYIFAQSKDMRFDLINNFGVKESRIILINNPVDKEKLDQAVEDCPPELKEKNQFTFVSAGRLTNQKGYDIIIQRMSELYPQVPFKLIILGSGELESELKDLKEKKGLNDYITFLGYKQNIASYLAYSDGLLLSSRYEGFPNIVLEAQSLGKPVFSNDCLGGINEIIINGTNGWTCNFEDSLSFKNGLKNFFNSDFSGNTIKELTYNRYGINIIFDKYIKSIESIL